MLFFMDVVAVDGKLENANEYPYRDPKLLAKMLTVVWLEVELLLMDSVGVKDIEVLIAVAMGVPFERK